jgi:hypothetical protein
MQAIWNADDLTHAQAAMKSFELDYASSIPILSLKSPRMLTLFEVQSIPS